jgi:hypothetical protein
MRITAPRLRQIIREVLLEGDESGQYAITSFYDPLVRTAQFTLAYDVDALEAALKGDPSGRIVIAGVGVDEPRPDKGHCNGARIVSTGGSLSPGWGTRVYLAALEINGRMAPDREHVSPAAEALWKSLVRRGLVTSTDFDDIDDPKTPPWEDDCKVYRTRDGALNASYRLVGDLPGDVEEAQAAGWHHMNDLKRRDQWRDAVEILMSSYDDAYRSSYTVKRG